MGLAWISSGNARTSETNRVKIARYASSHLFCEERNSDFDAEPELVLSLIKLSRRAQAPLRAEESTTTRTGTRRMW